MDATIYNLQDARSARNIARLTSKSFLTPSGLAGLAQQPALMYLSVTSFLVQYVRASLSFHAQVMSAGFWQCSKSPKAPEKPTNWL